MINIVSNFTSKANFPLNRINSPFPLTSIPVSTSSIKLWWSDLGYNYTLQRATNSGFTSNVITVYTGTSITFTDTGLSANTPYYYRILATSNNIISSYAACNSTTWAVTPTAMYSMEGGDWYGLTNNSYAQFTGIQVSALLDVSGNAAPTFTASTGNITYDRRTNRRAAIVATVGGSVYSSASDLVLTGDFCVAMYLEPQLGGTIAVMGTATDVAHVDISIARTALQVKINGSSYSLPFGGTITTGNLTKVVWKRVGTQASASLDGGYTYGTPVTVTTADFHVNKIFGSDVGSNLQSWLMFAFFSGSILTGDQLTPFFEPYKQSNYTVKSPVLVNPTFNGSWNNLVNGTPSFTGVSVNDNGSFSWRRVWSSGNYAFIKFTKDSTTYMGEQGLYLYNHLTGKYSPATSLPSYISDTDLHIQSSLLLWDNTVFQIGVDRWYSPSVNTLKIREFGQGYDIRRYTQKVIDGGIANVHASFNGYFQASSIGSTVAILMQKFAGNYADGLKIYYSTDRMNFWNVVQPITSTYDLWTYPHLLNNGTLNAFYFIIIQTSGSSATYPSISFLKTTDFLTYSNIDGSYTFTYDPLNLVNYTTIVANAAVRTTGSNVAKNVPVGNFYIDANAFVYGIHGNGENTGWEVSYFNSGWQHVAISFPAAQNIVLPAPGAGTNFNRVNPVIYKNDADVTNHSYTVFALCDPVSDGNYRVGKFTTTDNFASQVTFVGYVSTDNTKKHWNLQADFNHHFNNHSVVVGTQVNGTSALDWVYQVK